MNSIKIPTLLFWENGNSWYGSLDNARFFIKPVASESTEDKQLTVQLWKGPLAMELSEVIASTTFPVTEEGIAQTADWLEKRAAELNEKNSHPK